MTKKKGEVVDFDAEKEKLRKALEENAKGIDYASLVDDDKLEEMNKKHAFINSVGGRPMVLCNIYNEVIDKQVIEFRDPKSIVIQYSNQSVQVDGKSVELGTWWIKNSARREYDSVMFDPDQPKETKGCLNLYEGMSVPPVKGSWKRTLKHIYTILTSRDREQFKYVVKWFAWCLQNPGKRAEVVIIFKGKQGAGKGFIFTQFIKIFGNHGIHVSNRSHLTGEFNAHMRTCVFLFADEAYYPGDKEVEGALNQLISEEKIAIRAMRRDVVIARNCLHIGMATNADWVIPASGDARRYYINEVDNKYAKNQISDRQREKYFGLLWGEMAHGGREAMVYDLINMDLKGYHPRFNVPETEEYRRQSAMGMNKLDKVIRIFLDNGEFPGEFKLDQTYMCSSKGLRKYFERNINNKINTSDDIYLKKELRLLGATKVRKSDGVYWIFPPLEEARKKFMLKFSMIDFDDMSEKWVTIGEEY